MPAHLPIQNKRNRKPAWHNYNTKAEEGDQVTRVRLSNSQNEAAIVFASNFCKGRKAKAFFEQNTPYYISDEAADGDGYEIHMKRLRSMSIPANTTLKVNKEDGETDIVSN